MNHDDKQGVSPYKMMEFIDSLDGHYVLFECPGPEDYCINGVCRKCPQKAIQNNEDPVPVFFILKQF